jgi:molybdate/tungstate transport system ATP-binding protein
LALKIENVSKKFDTFSLRDVNLEVRDGEYFVLLGQTGAGKTVLLDLIMGFIPPDRGKIMVGGQDITNLPPDKREIAYVPQNCPLFPHMSVFENVEFGLKMRRITSATRKKAVNRIIENLVLENLAERMPPTLSGGEKQKVVLARVLVTEPRIVLLDEPLTAIDAETSRSFVDELKRINHELKVSFLHVTHDQMEAFSLADKIAIMREGKIVQVGDPNEILSNPVDEQVARFLGYENVFRVSLIKCERGTCEVNANDVLIKLNRELEDRAATIAIRPEDVVLTVQAPTKSPEWNFFEGTVKECTNIGPGVMVTINVGLILKALIGKQSFLELSLSKGKRVHVGFKAASVRIVSRK